MNKEQLNKYLDNLTREVMQSTISDCSPSEPETPTVLHPDDTYNSPEYVQMACFGKVLTLAEKDALVMRSFKREYWPDRLKEEHKDD